MSLMLGRSITYEDKSSGDGTDLDDDGSDCLIRAEEGLRAAGVLLGELAHDLHRLIGLIVGGIRSCGCPQQISYQSVHPDFSEGRAKIGDFSEGRAEIGVLHESGGSARTYVP
jgi:hypothetical protein